MFLRALLQTVLMLASTASVLLGAGQDWLWPQAWTFVGETGALSLAITHWLWRNSPGLLEARLSSPFRKDQRPFDRALILLAAPLYFAWLALIGLDAHRYMWSVAPLPLQVAGALLVGGGMVLVWETFRANSFAAPQVRVQTERAQTVVSDGPYRYVRHPMYGGGLLYFLGAPLMMGSLWGLIGSALLILAMALRTLGEEAVLKSGLPGYSDYMKATPWRLVPGVW